MIDFLDWAARAGGIVALLVATLAFVFKEKWKQLLQRSLSEDLERLKSSLSKSQAEHAASLTPQLEQIKHDFQQKLEAYKVSLIAQAEAAKAKGELKKSIALRYAEIEFERLVALERAVAPIASRTLSLACIDIQSKSTKDYQDFLEASLTLSKLTDEAEMFMSITDRIELIEFRKKLLSIAGEHLGQGKPIMQMDDPVAKALIVLAISAHSKEPVLNFVFEA